VEPAVLLWGALPLDQSSVTFYDYEPALADLDALKISRFHEFIYGRAPETTQHAKSVYWSGYDLLFDLAHFFCPPSFADDEQNARFIRGDNVR